MTTSSTNVIQLTKLQQFSEFIKILNVDETKKAFEILQKKYDDLVYDEERMIIAKRIKSAICSKYSSFEGTITVMEHEITNDIRGKAFYESIEFEIQIKGMKKMKFFVTIQGRYHEIQTNFLSYTNEFGGWYLRPMGNHHEYVPRHMSELIETIFSVCTDLTPFGLYVCC